jgi:uncharacterized protein (TIGR02001 family)
MLGAACAGASAQASFSASLMSDYRYRGVSLSGERAAASLSANMDFHSGLYAGLSLANARMRYTQVRSQAVLYAGFARRIGEGLSWDVGVADSRYGGGAKYNYREVYLGLSADRLAARVSLSPHYFGVGKRSVYTEVNGSVPLGDSVDLFGHAGYLHRDASRTDVRVGVSAAFDAWNVQLAWVATHDKPLYPALAQDRERRLVLTTSIGF